MLEIIDIHSKLKPLQKYIVQIEDLHWGAKVYPNPFITV